MNRRQIVPALLIALMMTSNVYAEQEKSRPHSGSDISLGKIKARGNNGHGHNGNHRGSHEASEIDAGSGGSAIAFLTGILLLAGERMRSKRRAKDESTEDWGTD
jgi:hypothetical protein